MDLSAPKNFIPPKDEVVTICRLVEEELSSNRMFDKVEDETYNIKRVRIKGRYEDKDCRKVCQWYKDIGWDDVLFRRNPFEDTTTFTFRTRK